MTQLIRALLVESDRSQIDRIRSNINRKFQAGIQVVNNYDDLLTRIITEQPQLLILGKIDRFNSFQICEECHKINQSIPIVLISRQEIIDSFFRRLAHGWGAIDVITNNQNELNQLFQGLDRSTLEQQTSKPQPTKNETTVELSPRTIIESELDLEQEIGRKAPQTLIHPLTGEVLVETGKLVLRSAVEKMQQSNHRFTNNASIN
jgi:hypothetical protein